MKRRNALKMVAASVGGLMALPSWATHWTPESLLPLELATTFLSKSETDLLAEITETIIPLTYSETTPRTEVPGAKALGVNRFVALMVADCFDKPAQETFRKGLAAVDELSQRVSGKRFGEATPPERLEVIRKMSQSDDPMQKSFVALVKNLTIRGYMTSEYVMTNITHYEMAPARYKGFVPVKK